MSYKEKQVWAMMISGFLVMFLYLRRVLGLYKIEGMAVFENINFWAKTMLIYMGIGVVLIIIVMIVLHVVLAISIEVKNKIHLEAGSIMDLDEEFDDTEDEMDRLINLKASQISYVVVGVGFVSGLMTLAVHMAPGIMLNIVYLSFMVGSMVEGIVKLYFYKRGVSHG